MDTEKIFLMILIGAMSVFAWFMVRPFLGYVLAAILLAFILHPLHRWTRKLLGSRLSAMFLMVSAIVLAVLPIWLASAAIIQDAQDLPQDLNQSDIIDTDVIEMQILEYTGRSIDIEGSFDDAIDRFTNTIFGNFSQIIDLATNLLIGITLMMFLVYYLIKDGSEFVVWLKDMTPVSESVKDALYENVRKTTWAVIKGHVLVSVVQALVAGAGLYVTNVPNPIFWTFIMMIVGFIPILGSATIWVPASVYLVIIGDVPGGIFLFLYGAIVVGLVDNIVRPLAVDRGADLHPAVVLVGVIGGVYFFGAAGLFIGPIILGVLKSALIVFGENYS